MAWKPKGSQIRANPRLTLGNNQESRPGKVICIKAVQTSGAAATCLFIKKPTFPGGRTRVTLNLRLKRAGPNRWGRPPEHPNQSAPRSHQENPQALTCSSSKKRTEQETRRNGVQKSKTKRKGAGDWLAGKGQDENLQIGRRAATTVARLPGNYIETQRAAGASAVSRMGHGHSARDDARRSDSWGKSLKRPSSHVRCTLKVQHGGAGGGCMKGGLQKSNGEKSSVGMRHKGARRGGP